MGLTRYILFKARVRRSALSDIKCEAQTEQFISDKARSQVP